MHKNLFGSLLSIKERTNVENVKLIKKKVGLKQYIVIIDNVEDIKFKIVNNINFPIIIPALLSSKY